ncbi:Na+ export ABC ABC transporter membrane-spanning permease [Streptococcus pneumoniae]|nr:Na+ export ABC ABC transporter membrane-spanning permease [Streptococcus pneumoniae]
MRNMWVVIKETYLRHVESWSFFFMVISPFLFLGISVGIGHLQGSSMAKNNKVAVVTTVPSVAEGLKNVNGVNFDYKDEASAKEAIKEEKLKGYLTIDQEDSVLKAVYHGETSLENGIKFEVTGTLNELQNQLNRSTASLSQEQEKRLAQTINSQKRLMKPRKIKSLFKQLQQVP